MSEDLYGRLNSLEKVGVKLGLQNIETVLHALGEPHHSYPSILIAGTNGKGSVGAMLHSILCRHGYRTAYYTSPHLVEVRERIKVGEQTISIPDFELRLAQIFEVIDDLLKTSQLQNVPTYFETLTALAFYYFRQMRVDFAVVEVGLGGRFDATNVLKQKLSVITSIDFDHEEFLGGSLAEIAAEKAGIMKPGSQCVTGRLHIDAARVIADVAGGKRCAVASVSVEDLADLRLEEGFPVFRYLPWGDTIRVNLRGVHQAHNAAVALLASEALMRMGVLLQREQVRTALNEVYWPGRLEMISSEPRILIDCAHNPIGVLSLEDFLCDMNWSKVVALFTAMRDKRILLMLEAISKRIDTLFLTRVQPDQRCATLDQLAEAAQTAGLSFRCEMDPGIALQRAIAYSCDTRLPLVVFGSIYLIGEILRITRGSAWPA